MFFLSELWGIDIGHGTTLTDHRTAREGIKRILMPALRTRAFSRKITVESSPMHAASSRTRTGYLRHPSHATFH